MNQKLRGLVRSMILSVLDESVEWEGYEGENIEATCKHCGQDVWLVWEKSHPAHKWTECGGIGDGSCNARTGADMDDDLDFEVPPTMRSSERLGASTKVKRSV